MSDIKIFSDPNVYKDIFMNHSGSNSEQILSSINRITKTPIDINKLYQLNTNTIEISSSVEILDFENKCIYISGYKYKGLIKRNSNNTNTFTIKNLNIYIYGDLGEENDSSTVDRYGMRIPIPVINNCGGIIQSNTPCFSVLNCNVFISGNIVGQYAGGICGSNCGTGVYGNASITNSNVFIEGEFKGTQAGSICGTFCGKDGNFTIDNCLTYCNDTRTTIVNSDSKVIILNSSIYKTTDPNLKIIEDLQKELSSKNQKIDGLETQAKTDKETIDGLETQAKTDKETIDGLNKKATSDKKTIDDLNKQATSDKQKIANLQIQIDKMNSSSCLPFLYVFKKKI
jgi:hypothetical protein